MVNVANFESSIAAIVPQRFSEGLVRVMTLAGVTVRYERLLSGMLAGAAALWVMMLFIARPSLLTCALLLPIALVCAYGATIFWLKRKAKKCQTLFLAQLQTVLQMLSGALRVGMGLRQALVVVIKDLPEPSRREFGRVIGRTAIGISVLDALDELAERMPSNEMTMTARTIRIQTKTGGDLTKILDNLAETIKSRRIAFRKMMALTAESRASSYVIVALPIVVGGFIFMTQPQMLHALLFTLVGRITLGIVFALEVSASLVLNVMMKFDI